MTLEFGLLPDDFDYERKGVAVDEIEISSDNNMVTVRTGLEMLSDADINQINEVNERVEQYRIHVSSVDEEYIFCLFDTAEGGHASKWRDGSTNQFVYVFEGIKGSILEIEYAIHETPHTWGPNSEAKNAIYLTIMETYDQTVYGFVKPEPTVQPNTIFSTVLMNNRVISNSYENSVKFGNYGLRYNADVQVNNFTDKYFDPFFDTLTAMDTIGTIDWQSNSAFFGGGLTMVTQRPLLESEIEIGKGNTAGFFVGRWLK